MHESRHKLLADVNGIKSKLAEAQPGSGQRMMSVERTKNPLTEEADVAALGERLRATFEAEQQRLGEEVAALRLNVSSERAVLQQLVSKAESVRDELARIEQATKTGFVVVVVCRV